MPLDDYESKPAREIVAAYADLIAKDRLLGRFKGQYQRSRFLDQGQCIDDAWDRVVRPFLFAVLGDMNALALRIERAAGECAFLDDPRPPTIGGEADDAEPE